MNKEYIERGALCKNCLHYDICIFHIDGSEHKKCVHFKNKTDVVEVPCSEWRLLRTRTFADGGYCSTFECPLCGREVSTQHAYDEDKYEYVKTSFPYCHCGAKMNDIISK
jgi:hypothetical protein